MRGLIRDIHCLLLQEQHDHGYTLFSSSLEIGCPGFTLPFQKYHSPISFGCKVDSIKLFDNFAKKSRCSKPAAESDIHYGDENNVVPDQLASHRLNIDHLHLQKNSSWPSDSDIK